MCGLAGIFSSIASDRKNLERVLAMRSLLQHRGPDDQGVYEDPRKLGCLAHTRLSILDLSNGGHQPMTTEDGRYILAFNGEIYNYRSLREELTDRGHCFRSTSDTEVLLQLYRQEGARCLDRLEGMFAFAVWDSENQSCFLARDPLGIKPLYIWHHGSHFAFASEIRSLLNADLGPRRLSVTGLAGYLLHGSVQEPETLVDGVQMLPAGHYAIWNAKPTPENLHIKQYWDINWNPQHDSPNSLAEAAEITRHALDESIRRHLISDVPVGIFLSGGIDSTAVAALARTQGHAGIKTFCIGFEESDYDESEPAARTANRLETDHHCWKITERDGLQLVTEFLNHLDQPSNDGFNTYCVSRFARQQGLKVVLSGLGGDELFGGYPSFQRIPEVVRWSRLLRLTGPLRHVLSRAGQYDRLPTKTHRFAAYLASPLGFSNAYWAMRGFFTPNEAIQLLRTYTQTEGAASIGHVLDQSIPNQPSPKDIVSYMELTRYMRNQLLRDSDVMSMANSLELRVPLVDRKFLESLRCIPSKYRHAEGKQLILKAVPEIPEWIANAPKKGFRFPFDRWITSQWGDLFESIDRWSPVQLGPWYRKWLLFTLHHFLRQCRVDIAMELP